MIWFLFVSNLFTISDLFNLHFMVVTIWIYMRKCWLFYWQFQKHRMNSQIFKLIKFWFCWLSYIDLDWWLIDMSTNANYICNQLETPWVQTKKQLNFTKVTWKSSQSLSLVRYGCSCNLYNCFWNDKNQKHSYWIDGYIEVFHWKYSKFLNAIMLLHNLKKNNSNDSFFPDRGNISKFHKRIGYIWLESSQKPKKEIEIDWNKMNYSKQKWKIETQKH